MNNEEAMYQLAMSLMQNNIWYKIKEIYPLVGGTTISKRLNLKDIPRYRRINTIRNIFDKR